MSKSLCQVHQTFCLKSEISNAPSRCVNLVEVTHTAVGKVCADLSWSAEHAVRQSSSSGPWMVLGPYLCHPPLQTHHLLWQPLYPYH